MPVSHAANLSTCFGGDAVTGRAEQVRFVPWLAGGLVRPGVKEIEEMSHG
jgi:hypothetical protein